MLNQNKKVNMRHFIKIMGVTMIIAVLGAFSFQTNAANDNDATKELTHFPLSKDGLVRHVIILPQKKNESDYKVELIPGKTMSVDCNNHRLMGTLTEEDLQGWGYTYFVFNSDGNTASTMMMCNQPNTNKFVTGQTSIIDYNSKLPIVIYAPEGFDVKYRIWQAGKEKRANVE